MQLFWSVPFRLRVLCLHVLTFKSLSCKSFHKLENPYIYDTSSLPNLTSVANHSTASATFCFFTRPLAHCHYIRAPGILVWKYLLRAHRSGFKPFCNPVPHRQATLYSRRAACGMIPAVTVQQQPVATDHGVILTVCSAALEGAKSTNKKSNLRFN